MARPKVRTRVLLRDDVERMKQLFGTVPNIRQRLRLDRVPPTELRRALTWLPVRPEHAELITSHWAAWRQLYLKDPEVLDLTLPPAVVDFSE